MKVSIITVSYNSVLTIEDTIKSVLDQDYPDIEYIIIDGGSTDGTMDIVNKYKDRISKIVSEKDEGMYDAMNKGIKLATGDVVGILNSDDVYTSNDVIRTVVDKLKADGTESVWGDLVYVDRHSSGTSLDEARQKFQYDLFYIKNRSFTLDVFIFLKTALALFMRNI
jgi:glycosyltransferase involved in cell wall biosynthesis